MPSGILWWYAAIISALFSKHKASEAFHTGINVDFIAHVLPRDLNKVDKSFARQHDLYKKYVQFNIKHTNTKQAQHICLIV